jgi:hypothetical protein
MSYVMGVYIFQSKCGRWIKIGHHKITASRPNVYFRVARRGFHSCVHPRELAGRLDEADFELVRWYPTLGRRDETIAHRGCPSVACGEFHPLSDLDDAIRILDSRGVAGDVTEEDRRAALAWARKSTDDPP